MAISPAGLGALLNGDMDNFITASTPGGIEAQEAAGQRNLVENPRLPKDLGYGTTREDLEKLGFQFGEDIDDIFVSAVFPEGWKLVATDHSMWSDLVDNKGRKRGGMFYKAAFYDRNAHLSLNKRFSAQVVPEDDYESDISYEERKAGNWYGVVKDGDEVIFKTEPVADPGWQKEEILGAQAKQWLNDNYPEWESVLSCWD